MGPHSPQFSTYPLWKRCAFPAWPTNPGNVWVALGCISMGCWTRRDTWLLSDLARTPTRSIAAISHTQVEVSGIKGMYCSILINIRSLSWFYYFITFTVWLFHVQACVFTSGIFEAKQKCCATILKANKKFQSTFFFGRQHFLSTFFQSNFFSINFFFNQPFFSIKLFSSVNLFFHQHFFTLFNILFRSTLRDKG